MSNVDAAESSSSTSTPGRLRLAGVRLDSQLLERAVLAHGLGSLRLSPLTFVADTSSAEPELGFHGTASTTTSKAGREIAGDAQRRRSALQVAGVPVPDGRVFEPDEVEPAIRYAEELRYPLTVKPASGRHRIGVSTNLHGVAAVVAALAQLHRSRYADRRFVVERHVAGVAYQVLVVGARAVSVLRRDDGHDVTAEAAVAVKEVAVRAVAAVPGLGHGGVDVVAAADAPVVVDVDASPSLAAHEFPAAGPGRPVTSELVRSRLPSPRKPLRGNSAVRMDMMLFGMAEADAADKLRRLADELGITAKVAADAGISARIEGPLDAVTRLPALMTADGIGPEIIETSAPVSRASTAAA